MRNVFLILLSACVMAGCNSNKEVGDDEIMRRFEERLATNAAKCPKCGEPAIPIAYGLPGPEMMKMAEEGKIRLGGCVLRDANRVCTKCNYKFYYSGNAEPQPHD